MPAKYLLVLLMALQLVLIPQSAHAMTNDTFEYRTQYHINKHRNPNVLHSSCLDRYAEKWARYLKRTDTFKQSKLSDVRKNCNLKGVDEILARAYKTPKGTVRAWLNSPPHQVVLTNPQHQRVGIGAVRSYGGRLVVVIFGRR